MLNLPRLLAPLVLLPLLILVATYVLLSVGRLPRLGGRRHRAWIALAGGVAMIATGSLALPRAAAAVNVDILLLLFGMLSLAATLEVCGFFDWLSHRIVAGARTQRGLLAATMIAAAVLSALILNDAVVLIFTPVLVKATRLLGVDPMPYLAGEAFAANIGSLATPVGNPQNAYIAIASGIPFATYVRELAPIAGVSLVAGIAVTLAVFRRSLARPLDKAARAGLQPPDMTDPRLFRAALVVLAAVFAGFLVAQAWAVSIAHVAFAGGLAVLALTAALAPAKIGRVARSIDASILVFFVGLFWVIAGFQEAGFSDDLAALFLGGGASLPAVVAWTSVLSQLVSNVPAVILVAPTVAAAGSTALWLALAASATLAGNASLVGAAANVIVAETARAHGASFSVIRFMLAGVPVALATLLLAAGILLIRGVGS